MALVYSSSAVAFSHLRDKIMRRSEAEAVYAALGMPFSSLVFGLRKYFFAGVSSVQQRQQDVSLARLVLTRVDGSQVPMLSNPNHVIDVIRTTAKAVQGRSRQTVPARNFPVRKVRFDRSPPFTIPNGSLPPRISLQKGLFARTDHTGPTREVGHR